MTKRIALVGASGFLGSAVARALEGHDVVTVTAPRLSTDARTYETLLAAANTSPHAQIVADAIRSTDVLINAAGNPDASSLDEDSLFGANALLPAVLARAARLAQVERFVHVSSAVVQNDKSVLDSSEDLRPFSPYSASKVMGELMACGEPDDVEVIRYRPPSVHAESRRVTQMIRRIASSPAATVARPGTQRTPQALLPNVAAAVAHLATVAGPVPPVVHHPSEGITAAALMETLSGGTPPRLIPRWLALSGVRLAKGMGRVHRPTAANARRIEILWLGQEQATSWLTECGWTPPVGHEGWTALGKADET